jgi:hypothetical protein
MKARQPAGLKDNVEQIVESAADKCDCVNRLAPAQLPCNFETLGTKQINQKTQSCLCPISSLYYKSSILVDDLWLRASVARIFFQFRFVVLLEKFFSGTKFYV